MKQTMINAILKAYDPVKMHMRDDESDRTRVPLLVGFTLGDLRELEAAENAIKALHAKPNGPAPTETIMSGG